MKKQKTKKGFVLLFLFLPLLAYNQEFNYKTEVVNTHRSGFVNIWLSPEINSKLTSNFSDLRIYNSENKEIPYILQQEELKNYSIFFKEYKILEKKHFPSKSYTRIVIHNKDKKIIDNISIFIKNAEVKKWLKLNGSDDNKTYYVLNDNYIYNSSPATDGTSEIKVLHFPQTDYEYLELLISDYFDKPINILKIGYYDSKVENGLYSDLPINNFKQTENKEKKQSIIEIELDDNQYIDKAEFIFNGTTYYLRNASLYIEEKILNKKKKTTDYQWNLIEDFEINSFSRSNLLFTNLYTKKLKLIIENKDNESLILKTVKLKQLTKYLTAELKENEQYTIKFGDSEVLKPQYDLAFFTDSIDKQLPLLKTKEITKMTKEISLKPQSVFNSYYVWIGLGLVAVALAFMSFKMMKDIKK